MSSFSLQTSNVDTWWQNQRPPLFPSIVFLLMFLVVIDSVIVTFTRATFVNIYSHIAIEPLIQVHCTKGKKDVIPESMLRNDEHVGWSFKPNFWGTAQYHYDFEWRVKIQDFYLWWDAFILLPFSKWPCTNYMACDNSRWFC